MTAIYRQGLGQGLSGSGISDSQGLDDTVFACPLSLACGLLASPPIQPSARRLVDTTALQPCIDRHSSICHGHTSLP